MSVRTVAAGRTSFLLREVGAGDGTPVLLLHGVPETSSCWRDLAPRLARGRRVLAPDLPGLGGSGYGGPYDVPSLVAELVALLEREAPGRAVDVVGHDWGGSLALGLAGARPDLVRRLVVANAPYRTLPLHRAPHIPFFALPGAPEALFRLGGRRLVRLMLSVGWRSNTRLDAESQAEYEAAYTNPATVEAMLGYYRAATRPRLAALLRRERPAGQPRVRAERMLVLWGARDPILPVSTGESVVRDLGPDCVMVTVPGAGHFVIEEAPQVVADVLVDFLGEVDEVTAAAAPPEGPAQHRVVEPAPVEAAAEAPTVGLVPVGGTPDERRAAKTAPKRTAPRVAKQSEAKAPTKTAARPPAAKASEPPVARAAKAAKPPVAKAAKAAKPQVAKAAKAAKPPAAKAAKKVAPPAPSRPASTEVPPSRGTD